MKIAFKKSRAKIVEELCKLENSYPSRYDNYRKEDFFWLAQNYGKVDNWFYTEFNSNKFNKRGN